MPPDAPVSAASGARATFGQPAEYDDYLIEARRRLFDRVRDLCQAQYTRRFGFGHGSIRPTLVHVADTEWWSTQVMTMLRLVGASIQGLDYSLMRWEWCKEHR